MTSYCDSLCVVRVKNMTVNRAELPFGVKFDHLCSSGFSASDHLQADCSVTDKTFYPFLIRKLVCHLTSALRSDAAIRA